MVVYIYKLTSFNGIYIILSRFAHPACAHLWRHAGDSFENALRLARPYLKYLNGNVFVQSPDDVVFVALIISFHDFLFQKQL